MPLQIRTADDRTKYSDLEIAVGEIQKHADALHKAQKTLNVLTQQYKQNASLNNQELQKLKALRAKGNQTATQNQPVTQSMESISEIAGPSTNGPFAYLMKNIGQAFGVFPSDATLKQMGTDGRRAVPTKDDSLAREFQYIQQELKKLDSIDYSKMPHDQFMKHLDKQLELMDRSRELIAKQMDSRRQKTNQIQTNSVQEDHYDEPASDYESEMLDNQMAFIKYAADEIKDHVHKGGIFPEWFQNKLSGVHDKMKSLHAYMEGERQQAMDKKRMMSMKDAQDDYFESLERKLNESKGLCKQCGKPSYTTLPEEKQKGVDGKVCWKGYKRMGTKKKGGKTVDNCVKM